MPILKTKLEARKCKHCGKEFVPKTLTSYYCCHQCSKYAYKAKAKIERENAKLREMAEAIPDTREYVSVDEACHLYNVCKKTIYRLIKKGTIPAINIGERLTRVKKGDLEAKFSKRTSVAPEPAQAKKLYSLEPEDCYTIGEISSKFNVSDKTVYELIRRNSIPTRQIGKYTYVPKEEIENALK